MSTFPSLLLLANRSCEMLKSTHRPSQAQIHSPSLPPNWTEHKAPTGHSYYYNSVTKQSTYQRPELEPEPRNDELLIDYNASAPDLNLVAARSAFEEFNRHGAPDPSKPDPSTEKWSNGVFKYDRVGKLNRQGDRPVFKIVIPGCQGWILVKTQYGRRFVHDLVSGTSLWKFPEEVMHAVMEMDRVEREKEQRKKAIDEAEQRRTVEGSKEKEEADQNSYDNARDIRVENGHQEYDSDEYEEVEVTDDEDQGQDLNSSTKRPRLDENQQPVPPQPQGPQAMDEDDIAYQLAQLEEEERLLEQEQDWQDHDIDSPNDPDDSSQPHTHTYDNEDDESGLPLTQSDNIALFRSLLDENRVSPYTTFDVLTENNTPLSRSVLEDDRWLVLPNMTTRKTEFTSWSRDRIAEIKSLQKDVDPVVNGNYGASKAGNDNSSDDPVHVSASAKSASNNPKVQYLTFLKANASTKLYWPEFKRKFRKEPAMLDRYLPDRDREKLYREYVSKLRLTAAGQRREMETALRDAEWAGSTEVPASVQLDLRFYVVRDEKIRKDVIDEFFRVLKQQ